jgi:hypothetical protein
MLEKLPCAQFGRKSHGYAQKRRIQKQQEMSARPNAKKATQSWRHSEAILPIFIGRGAPLRFRTGTPKPALRQSSAFNCRLDDTDQVLRALLL